MRRLSIASIVLSLVVLSLAGCGGGGDSKPAIGLSITPSSAVTIVQGQQKNFTATVSNDSTGQGVIWLLSGSGCTGSACGTLSNVTATSVTYNAPASVSSNLAVTVTATSAADKTKSASVAITVVPAPSITTSSLPNGTQNAAYTATTLAATGGIKPYKWSITSGGLPAGISLNSNTGVISGTPTAAGTSDFTVQVADFSSPALTATKVFSLVVDPPPPLSVTTGPLPAGIQGVTYTATLVATGGTTPYTAWTVVTTGTLPDGLTLHSGTGVIDGTPTTAGTSNFTVQVTDSTTPALTATKALSIVIAPAPLTITTTSLPAGTENSAYQATTLQSTGGTAPVSWSVTAGALPAGLTLHASTGTIDGTPTASGTANFTVTATDSAPTPQTKAKELSIVINAALAITTTSLDDGAVNTSYSATLAATGGTAPVTWAISQGTLPAGLTLNSSTGVISGTPTAAGTSNFSVKATDHSTPPQTQEAALSITMAAVPLAITTTSLSNATIGTAYTATLAATGGTPPISWSTLGSLPSWASLNSTTGAITGTPTGSPTTTNFTVTATDSGSPAQTKSQALSITTISGGVNDAELNGHYAFTARGDDSVGGGLVTMAGSFAADGNGVVTGGVMDINTTTAIHTNLAITGGFYSVAADQRGTLTLTTSQGNFNFAVALGSISSGVASLGRIIGADSKMVAGTLKKQDTSAFSTASITGNYAFGIGGAEGAGRFAAAGVVTLSGSGTYTISTDTNDAGRMNQNTGAPVSMSGTYAIGDSANGRGTMTDTTNGSHMAIYVVSASEVFLINTDPFSNEGPPIFTGSALKQSGTFNNASMNAASVFVSQSVSSYAGGAPSAAYVGAGVFTFNGTGGVTAEMDENDGGSIAHSTGMSATYTVASNGRMIISVGGSPIPEVFYLVGPGKAFSVGTDGAVAEGSLKRQDSGPFSNASITGNYIYGIEPPVMNTSDIDLGAVTANGAGSLTGTSTGNSAGVVGSESFTDTYSASANGRVVLSNNVMYIISTSKAVMIDVEPSQSHPTIHVIDK